MNQEVPDVQARFRKGRETRDQIANIYRIIDKAAAAAKLLQSCPTLCDPIDGSPPGFPVPGILQARTLEWGTIAFSEIKLGNSKKNIYFCFLDSVKAIDCVDHKKLWKNFKDMGIPDHLTCLMRNLYAGQEATVRTRHGTPGSKSGKENVKAVYCHPYLTYMQDTSCKMLGWMKLKLESRLLGEISATSDMQVTPL